MATGATGVAVTSASALGQIVPTWQMVMLVLLGIASIVMPLRFHHGGQVSGFSLIPAVTFTLAVLGPDPAAVIAAGVVALVGTAIDTRAVAKTIFNAAQNVIGASLGLVAVRVVLGQPLSGDLLRPRAVLALAVGAVVYGLSNLALVAEVLHRISGDPRRQLGSELLRPTLWIAGGDVTGALLLTVLAERSPTAILLAVPVFAGIQLSYRGVSADRAAAEQAELLFETSRRLLAGTTDDGALDEAVAGLARLFHADRVGLVVGDHGPSWLRPVAGAVVHRGGPVVDTAAPATLAVPVCVDGAVVGVLGASGPRGLKAWGTPHRDLLSTVAGEVAATLQARRLLSELEHERAMLAAETRKLSDVLASASDGIVVLSAEGRVRACNLAMQRLLGTTDDPTGEDWRDVLPLLTADGAPITEAAGDPLAAALAGQRRLEQAHAGLRRYDGDVRWLRCSVAPVISAGAADGVVLVAVDLTREHEVEELRGDFIATVSHELRTPLTPLRGFLGVLELHGPRLAPERMGTMVEAMQKQVDRLADLIGDLLQVAEMDRMHLDLTPLTVDLQEVVRHVVDVEAVAAEDRGRVTIIGEETLVVADPDALRRCVRVMVSNGLKHTRGAVTVVVGSDDGTASVRVADEGPRVPAAAREIVFEPFRRLGDHLHRTQGAGLGLAVGRSLAEAMGGGLSLHATADGRGNEFAFRIPVSVAADDRPPRGSDHARAASIALD